MSHNGLRIRWLNTKRWIVKVKQAKTFSETLKKHDISTAYALVLNDLLESNKISNIQALFAEFTKCFYIFQDDLNNNLLKDLIAEDNEEIA